ncbi:MAG: hypothetical protein LIO43_02255 [Clostridiales bacterium]|nr:hypothetical protein [Clostridiales bacterium]
MKGFKSEAYGYIRDMFVQHNMIKRTVLSFISVFILGFAISLFSLSGFGVDPYISMNMNISSAIGMRFGTYQLIINIIILIFVVIVAHRGLVGIGTVFNMIFAGYSCEFFEKLLSPLAESGALSVRIVFLAAGIVLMCFSSSLFFTANVGVGPYDTLSFMITHASNIPCKWTRVMTDISVILIGLVASGGVSAVLNGNFSEIKNIGVGTVITAFCMWPLVNFFNKYVSSKILAVDYESMSKDLAFFLIKGAMVKHSLRPVTDINNNADEKENNFKSAPFI